MRVRKKIFSCTFSGRNFSSAFENFSETQMVRAICSVRLLRDIEQGAFKSIHSENSYGFWTIKSTVLMSLKYLLAVRAGKKLSRYNHPFFIPTIAWQAKYFVQKPSSELKWIGVIKSINTYITIGTYISN